jgi:PAS domain-containing protein
MANKPRRFKAILERGTEGLGWTIVRLPFDPHTSWTQMLRLRVQGKVLCPKGSSVAFRTSLFPVPGESGHYLLLVNNRVQREAGISVGSVAEFSLEPDLEPRPAELPDELASLLDEEHGLRDFYDSLSESMRREIGKWITNVKSDASRVKRAEQMAERLFGAMEGEQELPPIITVAFRKRPKAAIGWAKMTTTQRRQELLGVYYYQSVEARQRRVDKLCDNAEKRA